jgi:hypothetical protein
MPIPMESIRTYVGCILMMTFQIFSWTISENSPELSVESTCVPLRLFAQPVFEISALVMETRRTRMGGCGDRTVS